MPIPQTPAEMEAILLSKLKADTGHELQEWMDLIAKESFEKPTQILHWLKESFNVKHGTAYVLGVIYFNDRKPVYADQEGLLNKQFEKKEELRPLYDELETWIKEQNPEVKFGICKGYVSLLAKKQCAVIVVRKDGVWLGLALDPNEDHPELKDAKVLRVSEKINRAIQIQESSDLNVLAEKYWSLAVNRFS